MNSTIVQELLFLRFQPKTTQILPEVKVGLGIALGNPLLAEYALPFQYLLPQPRIGFSRRSILIIIILVVVVDLRDIEIPVEKRT